MVAFAKSFESDPPSKASILIIEDEPPVLDLLVRILSQDYQVYAAADCPAAEAILAHEDIDIVICDHGLPGESGIDFLSRIRHQYPATQRILLTGSRDLNVVIRAVNEGDIHRYLAKPADFPAVCEAITTGLDKRKKFIAAESAAAEKAAVSKRMRSLRYLCTELTVLTQDAGKFIGKAMAIYFVGSLGFLFFGVTILLILYLVKSIMGVDMADVGLGDAIKHFQR